MRHVLSTLIELVFDFMLSARHLVSCCLCFFKPGMCLESLCLCLQKWHPSKPLLSGSLKHLQLPLSVLLHNCHFGIHRQRIHQTSQHALPARRARRSPLPAPEASISGFPTAAAQYPATMDSSCKHPRKGRIMGFSMDFLYDEQIDIKDFLVMRKESVE